MKTYSAKPHEVEAKWYVIDATDFPLGRLASLAANLLRGKFKPEFTPHVDMGDFVIVINAEKVKVTGRKETDKIYYRHTGFPGGLRQINFKDQMKKNPVVPIEKAVKGMLPHNTLGQTQFNKLKVYAGSEHPHQAQQPVVYKELEVIK
jgi:large subunit ribosomal protein L13